MRRFGAEGRRSWTQPDLRKPAKSSTIKGFVHRDGVFVRMRQDLSRNNLRRGNGQALIVAMLVLPLFFSVCALVVDGTNLMVNKRQMQNASDAAALAAGQELVPAQTAADACTGNSACLVAVQGNAALYGPVASAAQDYVEKNWRGSDPPTLTRCSSADETNCWSWPYQKDIYGVDPGYNDAAYHYVQVKL